MIQKYRKKRHRFPVQLPRYGPLTYLEQTFTKLQNECQPPPPRERKANNWISNDTWRAIDHRAMLRKRGNLTKKLQREWGRKIKAGLKSDRRQRSSEAAASIELLLNSGDLKEAWRILQGWYRTAEERAPKPCFQSMAVQTQERVDLYRAVPSPGESIPINVEPSTIEDGTPTDAELRKVVKGMRNG